MATTHPKMLRWFASKNPFFVFLKVTPLLLVFVLMVVNLEIKNSLGLLFLLAGMFTWSFFEYVTHRWVYHKVFKHEKLRWFFETFHLHHHNNLTDYRVLNAGLFLIYPLTSFFWLAVFLLSSNAAIASWFGIGALIYYFFYENVHYQIHHKVHKGGYMSFIQKFHLYHHYKRWNKNFGNTITFWDRLLGTYDPSYKQFVLTDEMKKDLIHH